MYVTHPFRLQRLLGGCLALLVLVSAAAGERIQGRSLVVSRRGIVASEHPLASQAGAMTLAGGGNAVDAAIAANAVMGVVAPMTSGMGGDLFAIVYEAKTGRLYGLNASGWAPAGLSIEHLRDHGFTNMPQRGIHSVTIPGAVAGWDALQIKFGRQPLARLLAPAIRLAEEGFPVTEIVAGYWRASEKLMSADPAAARTFLPGGHAPRFAEIFRNPDLAWSLRQVATGGRKAFYDGAVARKLLACSASHGGVWTAADLREFRPQWVDPISTTYRGWTVYEIPPQGQGIATLEMLNLLETFPLGEWGAGSARALHAVIEAKKLAYADLLRFVADPRFARVPVAGLLSKSYARERVRLIDPDHAADIVPPGTPPHGGTDTTYLCAVDAEGNMVSLIQSNYGGFGSGLVATGTGFGLQNRGGLFTLEAGHPNALAGRKRPLHTIIPGFMAKGKVRIAFGIMGGWNQAQAHAQFVADIADFDLNPQAALEAPRFTKLTFEGSDVEIESRVPADVCAALTARGHKLQVIEPFAQDVGGGQAVMRDFATGVNYGASDPRKDGAAVPEPVKAK
ncbi:MAG: gamma-glutamyltransferase [Verrucomicrobiota bacterium]|jgi:gamma-glutamyltranspeptidase/glutathione hydrolase